MKFMEDQSLSPTLTVEQLFDRWPQTMNVFVRLRFACVGCVIAPFDTLEDVAKNYDMPQEELLAELAAVIEGE